VLVVVRRDARFEIICMAHIVEAIRAAKDTDVVGHR
jgi:hypothetical protein